MTDTAKQSRWRFKSDSNLMFKKFDLGVIQSLTIIATALIYYCSNNPQLGLIFLSSGVAAFITTSVLKNPKIKLQVWYFLGVLAVLALVLNYESTVHAQILDGIDGALGDVGTAAGGSFATTVLDAVIDLIRIAIYIVVAGAIIAGIAFGVTQGQWQAPVMVVGVIISIALFLEIMGVVVFG
ncbi:MAG: hypothetical protein ACRC2S_00420 [Waterburya sp.]